MNNIIFQSMNDDEQREAIKLLKKCIKEGKITYDKEKANPCEQYCYISSGSVEGIYFPNSEIDYAKKYFDFVAVTKVDGELGITLSFNEDEAPDRVKQFHVNDYCFQSFISILYTYEERNCIEELQNNINRCKDELFVLKRIKRIYKKDGKPFADLTKNIDPNPEPNIHLYLSCDYSKISTDPIYVEVNCSELCTSAKGYKYNNYYKCRLYQVKTADDIEIEVKKQVENKEKYIAELESDIKNVKTIFKKAFAFKKEMSKYSYIAREQVIKAIK